MSPLHGAQLAEWALWGRHQGKPTAHGVLLLEAPVCAWVLWKSPGTVVAV